MARTNLSIDRKVFEEFATQVEKRNMTMFAYANNSLSVISKIAAEGGDPASLYSIWRVTNILKEADAIMLPSDFLEDLLEELYVSDKQRLLDRFRDLGVSLVGFVKIFADDVTSLAALAKEFSFFVPIKHFSLTKGLNGDIQVDVVGAGKRMAAAECSSEFLRGILSGYGYSVTKEDLHPGVMRFWAQRKSLPRAEVFSAAEL